MFHSWWGQNLDIMIIIRVLVIFDKGLANSDEMPSQDKNIWEHSILDYKNHSTYSTWSQHLKQENAQNPHLVDWLHAHYTQQREISDVTYHVIMTSVSHNYKIRCYTVFCNTSDSRTWLGAVANCYIPTANILKHTASHALSPPHHFWCIQWASRTIFTAPEGKQKTFLKVRVIYSEYIIMRYRSCNYEIFSCN